MVRRRQNLHLSEPLSVKRFRLGDYTGTVFNKRRSRLNAALE